MFPLWDGDKENSPMMNAKVMNAYSKKQEQMTNKHLNKKSQWDHPEINKKINSKEEYFAQVSKIKKPEDLEAILAEEDELWNS
jgi:hypothetical protein